MQPSLFTRLAVVEAELLAVKDMLAELKVNQDELRQDRDEWRWRAERLLADLQRGAWWRWWNRAAAALDRCGGTDRGLRGTKYPIGFRTRRVSQISQTVCRCA